MSITFTDPLPEDLGNQNEGEPVVAESVEEPVEEQVETTEEAQEAPESQEDAEEPKRKGGYKRKIEKLEKQNQELLEVLKRMTPQNGTNAEPAKPESRNDKPRPENFDSHEEYVEALTDWKIESRESQRKQQVEAERQREQTTKAQQTFKEKYQAAAKAHTDFEEMFAEYAEDTPTSPTMTQAVMESEHGSELMYYFLKNQNEAARIAGLTPIAAAREIGKIEAKFESKPETKKTVTNAPKPPSPVKAAAVSPHVDDMKGIKLY